MKNTTTTHAAALESREQKNARRTAEAHRRHTAPKYAPMTATADEHPTIFPALHDMTAAALYYFPELCAAFVIRARYRTTGLKLFADLATAQRADKAIMHDRTERADRATESRRAAENARNAAAQLDSIAARITSDPEHGSQAL